MINPLEKLFEELCNAFKDLIKKNIKFKGKLKGIEAKLEALKPVIQDMLQSNEVLDRSSNELKGLTEVIESGIELIVKCSKSRVWELFKKYKYANKLIEWEESLGSKFDILKVQTSRDVKDIAREVKETGVVVQDTAREVKETAVVVQDTEREVKETGVVVQDTAREVKGTGVVLQDTAREVKEIAATLKNVEASVENILIVIQNQPGESKAWMTTEVPELPGNTVGLDTHVKELNMKLVKDGGSMLVITAPGGSGKTTLAKMLYHDDQVKDKFTKKIFITVSKKSNYIVVKKLCQELGSQESEVPNEDNAFSWLKEFLKETAQEPLLLLLDDVWSESKSLLEKLNELCVQ
ncbi:probable disease resistance protein RXW24L isoform X2 [Rosa chinensis]|uniref:probable disease resistance protein RXW24L isoform X2 n=1 Tax=Rosa chinensis TaxID=74649 RepID=UPI001AD8FA12|nr:probable disease resistance protein RXW24L isoform X2 [Rosa chinensis]